MLEIRIEKRAEKGLRQMPKRNALALLDALDLIAAAPQTAAVQVSKLQGRPGYRIRSGGFRLIFEQDATTITAIDAGPRGSIYR